ncbi:MAG: glycosyltransferase [Acutalibacteraceae bacterium]|nr:glycosyltransferase [Acutalibacteraceae bacterium]
MKKVLFLIPTLGTGGAEKVLVNLANNLDKTKFDVTVQAIFDGGVNTQFLNSDVKYKYVFKRIIRGNVQLFKLFSPETLYKWFIKDKYDIAVAYLEDVASRVISGCNDKDTKTVSWIHIEQKDMKNLATAFRNPEEAKKCYNSFDNVICVSEYVQKDFVGILDFKKHTEVLYNTNETEQIVEKSKEEAPIKTDDEYINICAIGTLSPRKGFDKLARIHKKLLDEGIKQRVYVLGEGYYRSTLEEIIKENSIEDTFQLLGYDTNPYKYIRACDLFVCASEAEGFSTVVTESLVVGTPVVTTRCSGMEEQLGYNNEYGIVTDNNEQALYEGIKEILTEEGKLEYYAERALERGKRFNKEITVKAVEDMLEEL